MANRFAIAVHKKTGKPIPKVKRTSHYVQSPWEYEMECPKCEGKNIEWSEWEGLIWCYDCKKDLKPTIKSSGVFTGPIPIQAAELLGMCFDRWDMVNKKFIVRDRENKKDLYFTQKEYLSYKKGKK